MQLELAGNKSWDGIAKKSNATTLNPELSLDFLLHG